MTQPNISRLQLPCAAIKLLNHRPPMLLIDSLLEREGDRAEASAQIHENSLCYSKERGILPECFIELMAQTMAAANGYDNLQGETALREGFIVGLDRFEFNGFPQLGDELRIEIYKDMEFGSMKVMRGSVFCGTSLIASTELKVWEQDPNEE